MESSAVQGVEDLRLPRVQALGIFPCHGDFISAMKGIRNAKNERGGSDDAHGGFFKGIPISSNETAHDASTLWPIKCFNSTDDLERALAADPSSFFGAVIVHRIEDVEPMSDADIQYTIVLIDGNKLTTVPRVAGFTASNSQLGSQQSDSFISLHFMQIQVAVETAIIRLKLGYRHHCDADVISGGTVCPFYPAFPMPIIKVQRYPSSQQSLPGYSASIINVRWSSTFMFRLFYLVDFLLCHRLCLPDASAFNMYVVVRSFNK